MILKILRDNLFKNVVMKIHKTVTVLKSHPIYLLTFFLLLSVGGSRFKTFCFIHTFSEFKFHSNFLDF